MITTMTKFNNDDDNENHDNLGSTCRPFSRLDERGHKAEVSKFKNMEFGESGVKWDFAGFSFSLISIFI